MVLNLGLAEILDAHLDEDVGKEVIDIAAVLGHPLETKARVSRLDR